MATESEVIIKITLENIAEGEKKLKDLNKELKNSAVGSDSFKKVSQEIALVNDALSKAKQESIKYSDSQEKEKKVLGEVNRTLGDMKKELRELSKESGMGKSAAEVEELSRRIGTLKNDIADASSIARAMDKGELFNNMTAGLQGAIASVQLFTAGLKLMGMESETAKKLEAATLQLISATQALQVLRDLKEKGTIRALVLQVKEIATNAAHTIQNWAQATSINAVAAAEANKTVIMGKSSIATKAITALQWLWNSAIAANPIGAIIVAIAALAVGIAALAGAFSKANKESASTIEINKRLAEAVTKPIAELENLAIKIKNTAKNTKEHKDAVDAFNKIQKENNGTLLSYNATLSETNKIIDEAKQALIKKLEVQVQESVLLDLLMEKNKAMNELEKARKKGGYGAEEYVKLLENGIKAIDAEISNVTNKIYGFKTDYSKVPFVKEEEKKDFAMIDGTTHKINKTTEELLKKNEKINESLNSQSKELKEQAKLTEKQLDKVNQKINLEREAQIEQGKINNLKPESSGELPIEEELTIIETKKINEQQFTDWKIESYKSYEEQVKAAEDRIKENVILNEEEKRTEREKSMSEASQTLNELSNLTSTLMQYETQTQQYEYENQQQLLDSKLANDLAKAGNNAEQKKQIQATYDNQIAALNAANEKKNLALKKKYANVQATMEIAQIGINTAKAVMAAGNFTPPFSFIFQAAEIAMGAVQIAMALKQRSQIMSAQAGAGMDMITTKPTTILVGDNPGHRERVIIQPLSGKGETKIDSNSGLVRMAGGGTVTSEINGRYITDSTNSDLAKSLVKAFQEMPAPVMVWKDKVNFENKQARIVERATL